MSPTRSHDPSRVLTLLNIAYIVLLSVAFAFDQSEVTDLAGDATDDRPAIEDTSIATVVAMLVLTLMSVGGIFGGSVLLLLLKPLGAWLHLLGNLCLLALVTLISTTVGEDQFAPSSAIVYLVEAALWMTAGCLYGVAFFTSALHKIDAGNETTTAGDRHAR